MERVTLADVARRAGVSKATVSRVLGGVIAVEDSKRERVLAAVTELGYVRDPALATIARHRWKGRGRGEGEQIAGLAFSDAFPQDKMKRMAERYLEAEGYGLTVFSVAEYPNEGALARVLDTRGIRGIWVPQQEESRAIPGFPWERFAVVSTGVGYFVPPGIVVRYNPFDSMMLALERALAQPDTRRVGLILSVGKYGQTRLNEKVVGALALMAGRTPDRVCGTVCEVRLSDSRSSRLSHMEPWLKAERIDTVIGGVISVCHDLIALGYRIPEDLRFLQMQGVPSAQIATVQRDNELELKTGMETLLRELSLWRGKARQGLTLVLEPRWSPGASFPEQGDAA